MLLSMKKVCIVIAQNHFSDDELAGVLNALKSKNIPFRIASSSLNECTGTHTKIAPNITISEIDVREFDGIILIGGNGAEEFFGNKTLQAVLREFDAKKLLIGAICITPVVLAQAGILNGKQATVFSHFKFISVLRDNGAHFTTDGVVTDNNIVTASGPRFASEFGSAIVDVLKTI